MANYIGLFVAIALIIVTFTTCITCFYKGSKDMLDKANKKMIERAERMELMSQIQNIEINSQNRSESRRDRELNLIKENKEILEKMLKEELTPNQYENLSNEYCSSCTICLEHFNKNDMVVLLLCKHLFHFPCLKHWLTQNILSPKCPNCNNLVIDDNFKHEKMEEVNQLVNYWQFRQQTENNLMRSGISNNHQIQILPGRQNEPLEPSDNNGQHLSNEQNYNNNNRLAMLDNDNDNENNNTLNH